MIERILSMLNSIPADKVAHFAVGSILFALALPFTGAMYAVAAVAIIGFIKECYDLMSKAKHTPDVWDAMATAAGGALGYFCTCF
jgi:hypothetical protein